MKLQSDLLKMKTKTFAVIGRQVIVVLCINIYRSHCGFWNQVERKKLHFFRKSHIICVKMFVSYVSYQHFYRLRVHAACGISTLVILKPLDTISSRVCADRNKKQHDLFLTLTRASARRCNNLKLKTGEKSSDRTEKKHNNNISVLCRNTHGQHFIHIHVTNSRICSRGPNSGGFSHNH